jgi:hypothetical protein
MVAMNSIPQQEVANGQSELARAIPTTSFRVVKNPSPTTPSGAQLFYA